MEYNQKNDDGVASSNDSEEEEEEEVMELFDLVLPDNDKIDVFKKMNNDKRVKCIYAGLHALESLESFAIKSENALMHKKMTEKDKKYKNKIKLLGDERDKSLENIQFLQSKMDEQKKQYLDELKSTANAVEQKCTLHFKTSIENMKNTIEELRHKLHDSHELNLKKKETWMQEQNEKINTIRERERTRYEKYMEDYHKRLQPLLEKQQEMERLRHTIEEQQKIINNNSSIKGKAGEFIMVDHLKKFIIDYQTKFIGKSQKNAGDILLENNKYKLMVESKDYKKALPKKEIEKFIRDHKAHPEYDASILINLHEEISCHTNFQLEEIDGRFVIYLSRYDDNPSIIRPIICILEQLIDQKKTQGDVSSFIDTIDDFLKKCNEMIKKNNSQLKNLETFYLSAKTNIQDNLDFYKHNLDLFQSHGKKKPKVKDNKKINCLSAKEKSQEKSQDKDAKKTKQKHNEKKNNKGVEKTKNGIQKFFQPPGKINVKVR